MSRIATLTLAILTAIVAPGCAVLGGEGSKSPVDFRCVLDDERLGAPFTDPERARAWLSETHAWLQRAKAEMDGGTWKPTMDDLVKLADLGDLAARAAACVNLELAHDRDLALAREDSLETPDRAISRLLARVENPGI